MFKLKRKKTHSQPGVSPASGPTVAAEFTARSLLSNAAVLLRWQGLLAQYPLTPGQRAAYAPLIEAQLTPSLSALIEHAETQGLITCEEAATLRGGQVIVDWSGVQPCRIFH